jgi:hypothetical protein
LATQDGALKIAANNAVVDAASTVISETLFSNTLRAIDPIYAQDVDKFRFLAHHHLELDWRTALSARQSILGDTYITGLGPVAAVGIPVEKTFQMPVGTVLLTNPQNICFGIQRSLRIETLRDPRRRMITLVVSARVAVAIEEVRAMALLKNVIPNA